MCQFPTCKSQNTLNFCLGCWKYFCGRHFQKDVHKCGIDETKRCDFPTCVSLDGKLTFCPGCWKSFCSFHTQPLDHSCGSISEKCDSENCNINVKLYVCQCCRKVFCEWHYHSMDHFCVKIGIV